MSRYLQFYLSAPDASLLYHSSYSPILVTTSVLIAILGSYAALNVAPRIAKKETLLQKLTWITVGAVAMGGGTWSMHFIGMLALELSCHIQYDPLITIISIAPSILASAVALSILGGHSLSANLTTVFGSLLFGAGIATMHYTGMAAMKIAGQIRYDPTLFSLSVAVAIVFAYIALHVRKAIRLAGRIRDGVSAFVMGLAISSMHYTAMAAAFFVRGETPLASESLLSPHYLAAIVIVISVLLILLVISIAATARNIEIARKLQQNEEQLRFMLEISPIAVRVAALSDYRTLFINRGYIKLIDSDEATALATSPRDYYENPSHYDDSLAQISNHERVDSQLVELVVSNAEHKWVIATFLAMTYERQPAVLNWFYDVTDRKQAEEVLKLHASVFLYSQEGIAITDKDNHFLDVNEAFTRITGYTREEVLGKTPHILSSGLHDRAFYEKMWASINEHGLWRGEIWDRRKTGEPIAEILTITSVKDDNDEVYQYVGIGEDVTDLKNTQHRLEVLTYYDPLTQLPNRSLMMDRLKQGIGQAKRSNLLLAVCFLDIDGFKVINDRYGHQIGDKLLLKVSKRLSSLTRAAIDTVSRISGDEFVILLSSLLSTEELDLAITRIFNGITKPLAVEQFELHISASIGVTVYPLDDSDADTLLRHANYAMYEAKRSGRNQFQLFDTLLDEQIHAHNAQLVRITQALENNEFVLYYQPKVNLHSGEVVGMEALIRWQHPEKGLLLPSAFLPIVEPSHLIIDIGYWTIDRALAQINEWMAAGLSLEVSVNITGKQIQDPNFIEALEEQLANYPEIPSTFLELEILESSALEVLKCSEIVIEACKRLGISFALDDFGTAYSSLSYLRQLRVDTLKIDQTFVRNILDDKEDQAIIEGVIQLAKVFKRKVIAEGVETQQHAEKLMEMGCELAQGYGIARPMPAEEVLNWVAHYRASFTRILSRESH